MKKYEIHPAATIFPMMTDEEYQGLKNDIAENGQREAVIVWNDQLIDGRNRMQACIELDREPRIAELDSDQDPWKYVISHNLHRRHLTESQRGMVAAKLARLKNGRPAKETVSIDTVNPSIDAAAKQLKVGRATVARAKVVQEHGSESVKQAVEQGSLSVSLAAKLVKKIPDKQSQESILESGTDAVREAVADVDVDQNQIDEFVRLWNQCSDIAKIGIRSWLADNDPDSWMTTPEIPDELR